MKIFAANLFNHYHQISHENRPHKNYKNMSFGSDIISFSARRQKTSPEERMTNYANKLLDEKGLKKGQRIYIKGESYYLPFMEILSKEAYKRHQDRAYRNQGKIRRSQTNKTGGRIRRSGNQARSASCGRGGRICDGQ